MRTTKTLLKIEDKLNLIHIVEINDKTFLKIKKKAKKFEPKHFSKIQIYNAHIMDYVLRGIDRNINLVYLDVCAIFFDSEKSKGTQGIIDELLVQLRRDKILFAATFCLRTTTAGLSFKKEMREILERLHGCLKNINLNTQPL